MYSRLKRTLSKGVGYFCPHLVMMARWGGAMHAPMKRTTFSCLVCL